jgi:hypothetical protein
VSTLLLRKLKSVLNTHLPDSHLCLSFHLICLRSIHFPRASTPNFRINVLFPQTIHMSTPFFSPSCHYFTLAGVRARKCSKLFTLFNLQTFSLPLCFPVLIIDVFQVRGHILQQSRTVASFCFAQYTSNRDICVLCSKSVAFLRNVCR